jgi:hypothetical protein
MKSNPTPMLIVKGEKFVVIPSEEYRRLKSGRPTAADLGLPALPGALPDGTYPASETVRASMARKIILARRAAGLSQTELAKRAHIRALKR